MTLRRKFILWIVLLAAGIGALSAYGYYRSELNEEAKKLSLLGRTTSRVVIESLEHDMIRRQTGDVSNVVHGLGEVKSISGVWLINPGGIVKAATDRAQEGRQMPLTAAGCRECHDKGLQGLFLPEQKIYRWAQPVRNKPACFRCHGTAAKNNGILLIDFSTREFDAHVRRQIFEGFSIFFAAFAVLTAILIALTQALIMRRIHRVGTTMRAYEEGDAAARVPVEGHDDISRLESGFNELAEAITSRDRQKDALVRAIDEQLRFSQVLIDAIPVPIFYKDAGGVYRGCNRAFEEFLGLPKEKVVGKTVYDIAPRELADKYWRMDKELFDHPGVQVYEYSVKHADGAVHEVIFNKATYTDAEGKVAGMVGAMHDITERKKAEAALRDSTYRLNEAQRVAHIGYWERDLVTNKVTWSDELKRILGMDSGQANPDFDVFLSLIHPEDRPLLLTTVQETLQKGKPYSIDYRVIRKDGSIATIQAFGEVVHDESGKPVMFRGTAQDVTRHRWLEQKLAQSESHLRAVIDTEPECVKVVARDGAVLEMNPAGLAMIEADSFDQVSGMQLASLVAPEHRAAFTALAEQTFKGGSGTLEFEIIGLKGTRRWLETHTAPLRNAQGQIFALLGVTRDITERKASEEQLRLFKQSVDISSEAAFWFDSSGRFVYVNEAACMSVGYERDELLRMSLSDINPLRSKEKWTEAWDHWKALKTIHTETRHRHKDGSIFPVEISSTYVKFENQEYICGFARDITDRKKAEQTIQRNYDTQRVIGRLLQVSLEDLPLESILKQALDLILSVPWLSFESRGGIFLVEGDPKKLVMKAQKGLAADHAELCSEIPFGRCLCGKAAATGELQFADRVDERHEIRYDGMVPHGHYCMPIRSGGAVLGVINMYLAEGHRRDEREVEFLEAVANALAGIVQRKRIEGEREKLIGDLRQVLKTVSRSYKEWQDTFDSITDEIAIIDGDFRVVKANKAFAAHYGMHPRDVINRTCHDLVHGTASPLDGCPHARTMASRRAVTEEILDPRTNRLQLVSTFPYLSPDGELIGSIHIARDITDEKEREMRLIMSERLAALGQMASGIAHEINNPLASIAGCSEGLLSRVKKGQCDEKLFETYLGIIQEEVFRCKSITTSMLSFVRKATYERKDIGVNALLDRALEIISFQGRLKEVGVVRNYEEPLPLIHGNEGELRQVLLAIITNALDAMEDRGTLTIESASGTAGVVIRISDTGAGIAPDVLTRIYDPFFTTKSEKGGTGLGLSIARKIVSNHSGNIDVSSIPGRGTTFIITLPQQP